MNRTESLSRRLDTLENKVIPEEKIDYSIVLVEMDGTKTSYKYDGTGLIPEKELLNTEEA